MSLELLKSLNGSKNGLLKSFINKYDNGQEPRIAWYPSAGTDFRALLYTSAKYAALNPASNNEPKPPDIFIFTDYWGFEYSSFLDTPLIFEDENTKITVISSELLPDLVLPRPDEIVSYPETNSVSNKVAYLNVQVESDELGIIEIPVIYAFVVNEEFMSKVIIPNNGKLSHIIKIRYGGGLGGGGKVRGNWILHLLNKVGCELLICDNSHINGSKDEIVFANYPNIASNHSEPNITEIRKIDSEKWSRYGDVSWYVVAL